MDSIFNKFVTCCNCIQTRKGTIGWAFGNFNLLVAAIVAIYVSAYLCRQTTIVSSSTRYAGDYIISCVIFLGNLVRILFSIYKPVKTPPASDLARSIRNAGDNIVARTSDGSEKSNVIASDDTICRGVQTESSWWTRLVFRIRRWTNTFELDCSTLGHHIGPLTEPVIWKGWPMKQRYKATCALVACTVAVEAINWFVYASSYGEDTPFPWVTAEPHKLLKTCLLRHIWNKDTGASVCHVLNVIQEWGGVPLTNPPSDTPTVLPLISWKDYTGDQLTQELVAKLLSSGPCIMTLWVCPWYYLFDASRNNSWVYRGCGRSQENRAESERLYGKKVSSHAAVCLGYRRCGDQMHVLVLDNHEDDGPLRWVDVREIDGIYTLTVQ